MQIPHIRLLLSSPGELSQERQIVKDVCSEINLDSGQRQGFHIDVITWETHAYSARGEDGQSVLNKQFPEDYEIYLGMLGNRFGTATPRWGSGTEEEYRLALGRNDESGLPRLMFYFAERPVDPTRLSAEDMEQVQKVAKFRRNIETEGVLHFGFSDEPMLKVILHRHINATVQDVLAQVDLNELPLLPSEDEARLLPSFRELLKNEPLVHSNELVALSAQKLGDFAARLNRANSEITKLTQTLVRETRNINRSIKKGDVDKVGISLGKTVAAIADWQRFLRVTIPLFHADYLEMTSNLQRAHSIAVNTGNLERMPFDLALGPMEGMLTSFSEVAAVIDQQGDAFQALMGQGNLDLDIQAKLTIALQSDLKLFFEHAIGTSRELRRNVLPNA